MALNKREVADRKRVRALYAFLDPNSGAAVNEREKAQRQLHALLLRMGATWNDIPRLIAQLEAHEREQSGGTDPRIVDPIINPFADKGVTPADTVRAVIDDVVRVEPFESVAVTLWVLHSYVYEQFRWSPRLHVTSPVRYCGKSTLFDLLALLVARPEMSDNWTAATLYRATDDHHTVLADEADNLEVNARSALRAILNGCRRGSNLRRIWDGQARRFNLYAPVALACIGKLPLPLASRCITIRMTRHLDAPAAPLDDPKIIEFVNTVFVHIGSWVRSKPILNPLPLMPEQVRGRLADNWRPLISIADALSPAWGALARQAAIHFGKAWHEQDVVVVLLGDIRKVFDARDVDRLNSKLLVDDLNAMEDTIWSEWTGVNDDQQPRKLTQGMLARLLREAFQIRPRTVWPLQRKPGDKSNKGYCREQFEAAWRNYCPVEDAEDGTPAQSSKIKYLWQR